MPASRTVIGLVAAAVVLSACPGVDPCEGTEGVPPSLELGEGPDGFERPIADGETMEAEFGPQGGYHIWPAVRTTGFAPGLGGGLGSVRDAPTFVATLRDGAAPLESVTTILPMDGTGARADLALFRLPLPDEWLDDAGPLRLEVSGTDVCGTRLEATRTVTVTVPL